MRQKYLERFFRVIDKRLVYSLAGLGIIGLLLVACGGASTSSGVAPMMGAHSSTQDGSGNATPSNGKAGQYGPQYLQKSLQVTMTVQNTTQAANELQQWLSSADPQATSDGTDYTNADGGQYNVNLAFLVDVDHYTLVEKYLQAYAQQKGNTLINLHESVQDVTNSYVDSQSTLTNLRAEQQRLLGFMSQAQNVNDALNIEQQLGQVEGQINDIEAHLNALKGQTTFYTVTISLEPVGSALPPNQPGPWSVVPVWQGAWSAVIGVWQVLATLLVWLLAFSVYIVPATVIIWLVRKRLWRWKRLPHVAPALATPMPGPQPKDVE